MSGLTVEGYDRETNSNMKTMFEKSEFSIIFIGMSESGQGVSRELVVI
jgi:hypothetical protein